MNVPTIFKSKRQKILEETAKKHAQMYPVYSEAEGAQLAEEKVCKCGAKYHWCEWATTQHAFIMRDVEMEVEKTVTLKGGKTKLVKELEMFPTRTMIESLDFPHSYHDPNEHPNIPCQPRGYSAGN